MRKENYANLAEDHKNAVERYRQLEEENVDTHILERLMPNNLLPYIYNDDNELFTPVYQKDNVEWLIFERKAILLIT